MISDANLFWEKYGCGCVWAVPEDIPRNSQKQGGSGTELEPETGTVGTVFPETEVGTGTVGTVFQEPKPELEPSLSNSLY